MKKFYIALMCLLVSQSAYAAAITSTACKRVVGYCLDFHNTCSAITNSTQARTCWKDCLEAGCSDFNVEAAYNLATCVNGINANLDNYWPKVAARAKDESSYTEAQVCDTSIAAPTCDSSTCTTSWTNGTNGVQYGTNKYCSGTSCVTGSTVYRCQVGYWGDPKSTSSGCTKCECDGTTSVAGSTSASSCYLTSGQTCSDTTGSYTISGGNCYWAL